VRANLVVGKDLPIPRRADGIRLQDSHGSLIEDNTVEDSRDLAIWQSNDCVTRRNVVRRCRYGLHYMYCDRNVFEGNEFAGNHTGAAIMYSRHVTLRDNRFTGSRGPSAHGLLIKTADDVIAEHNWFVDNTRGIFLEDTPSSRRADCVIRSNVIGGNDTGVAIEPSVARVVFTENAFIANRAQVEALGWTRAEQNVWSADGRGNYWSDYVGFDADGNGVGDTPYQLEQFFEDLASRYPAVGMLRMAPAAAALECAARAFPIVKPRPTLTDACPLVDPPASLGQPPRSRPRPELVAAGLLLVGAAGLVLWQSRRPLLRGAS
ncbi:MAG: NosD domain-containing protein, partial [Planctomycetota bacterium]